MSPEPEDFIPWDHNRCPAIINDGSQCKNQRYRALYRQREYCALHTQNPPRGTFYPNKSQLEAMDAETRERYEGMKR